MFRFAERTHEQKDEAYYPLRGEQRPYNQNE